jgi:molecular chaperone HtpG
VSEEKQSMSDTGEKIQEYKFEAEVSQVLSLVINSLYSNKEIFLRELVSNAADAIDKVRFRAISEKDLLGDDTDFRIRVSADADARTVTIDDNGVGMTREELVENLGTIAHSGSRAFLEQLKAMQDAAESGQDVSLIGQFGVGFYSSFLIADEVEVITRAAGSDEAWCWKSNASDGYTIEPADRAGRGTSVVLHLKEDQDEYLNRWRLKTLINRYADYVSHSIELPSEEDEDGSSEWEQVNAASALWRRSTEDISDEQYAEFYKHLTHDWQAPLRHTHFKLEGMQQFTGLLFLPSQPPFDMYTPETEHGIRLYVKRVFIMEDCKELLPRWLRFIRGVVDSDDLPLNVSRETLQDSRAVRVIEKQVIKKTFAMLEEMAEDAPEDYEKFWEMFGRVLKEGLHYAPTHKAKLAKLMRYESSTQEGLTSLADYVERMPEGQNAIYYALAPSRALLESSPHLEVLKKKGYEILYMTDGVDEWAMQSLNEFDEKPMISALSENLDLGDDEESEEKEARAKEFASLTERFSSVLDNRVKEVRVSERLEDSPVCLVIPEGGMHAHIERLLRAQDQDVPATRRILEVNPNHSLIKHLHELETRDSEKERVADWIELLYDQALVAEGSPVENPGQFAKRLTTLMEKAAFSSLMK